MICTSCNATVPDTARFCTHCGAQLISSATASASMPTIPPTPAAPSVSNGLPIPDLPPAPGMTNPSTPAAATVPSAAANAGTPYYPPAPAASSARTSNSPLGDVEENLAVLSGFVASNAISVLLALLIVVALVAGLRWWGLIPVAIFLFALYAGAAYVGDKPCGFETSLRDAFKNDGSGQTQIQPQTQTSAIPANNIASTSGMMPSTVPPAPSAAPATTMTTMQAIPSPDAAAMTAATPTAAATMPATPMGQQQPMQQIPATGAPQTIIIQTAPEKKSNGVGTAGFVLSLMSILFSWTLIGGAVIWILGLVLSFIGMFRKPRGLAITGFILCLPSLILIIVLFTTLGHTFGLFS